MGIFSKIKQTIAIEMKYDQNFPIIDKVFHILSAVIMILNSIHWWVRKPSRGPNYCMFWATTETEGEVGILLNRFKAPASF